MLPQLKKKEDEKRTYKGSGKQSKCRISTGSPLNLVVLLTPILTVLFNDSSFSNFSKALIFQGIPFFPLLVHQFL